MTEIAKVQAATVQDTGDLLTFEQAGAWLGFDRLGYKLPGEAARNLCRSRKLRYIRIGKRCFIRQAWLVAYLDRESVPALNEAALGIGLSGKACRSKSYDKRAASMRRMT